MKAINNNRDGLFAMVVSVQQLDSIINFASSKSNMSKDLKQAHIGPLMSMIAAKEDRAMINSWQKRVRQPSDEKLSCGGHKASRLLIPKMKGSHAGKSDPSRASSDLERIDLKRLTLP